MNVLCVAWDTNNRLSFPRRRESIVTEAHMLLRDTEERIPAYAGMTDER